MTNGQLVVGYTGSNPVLATLTGSSSVNVVNGAGSITLSALPAGITLAGDVTGAANANTVTKLNNLSFATFFSSVRCAGLSPLLCEGLRLGAWAAAQGFAITEHARPLPPTESSSLPEPPGLRVFETGSSLPVALHGRLSPPQLLSATGLVTLA